MNKVLLELNSYTQKARIFLNGIEPSIYSELKNYTYKQIVSAPGVVLDAIGRELNDDFDLTVTAPSYLYDKVAAVAEDNEYCNSCITVAPKIALSTAERFERVDNVIQPTELVVLLTKVPVAPETVAYGPVTVSFTTDQDADVDYQINFVSGADVPPSGKGYVNIPITDLQKITLETIVSICEAYFLDPYLGKVVSNKGNTKEIAVLSSFQPIVEVIVPSKINAGEMCKVGFQTYPASSEMPSVVLQTSNPDVVAVNGFAIKGIAVGAADIMAYISGENNAFFTQRVVVDNIITVQKIVIDLPEQLHEDKTMDLNVTFYPHDADDTDSLRFEIFDPSVAKVVNGKLSLLSSGEFTMVATTTSATFSHTYSVIPSVKSLEISKKKIELPVGGRMPINVTVSPENAYNPEYTWASTDKTVAIVEKDEDGEYIKAVGIGSCTLTCYNEDKSVSDTCSVNVISMLYAKKNKGFFAKLFG